LVRSGAVRASPDERWIPAKRGFLFPVRGLAVVFRGKYLEALRQAFEAEQLDFARETTALAEPSACRAFWASLFTPSMPARPLISTDRRIRLELLIVFTISGYEYKHTTMHISLPGSLIESAKEQAEEGQLGNVSDYVRSLIRTDVQRREEHKLEQMLLEGVRSGQGIEKVGSTEWKEFRKELAAGVHTKQIQSQV
jgi:antitoxin ParD1/3/4